MLVDVQLLALAAGGVAVAVRVVGRVVAELLDGAGPRGAGRRTRNPENQCGGAGGDAKRGRHGAPSW